MIVGIDPGFSGAIVLLDPRDNALEIWDMPILPGKKGKTILDLYSLAHILSPGRGIAGKAFLEQVNAMPGQGVSSMFRFGQAYGAIQMALAGHGYETHDVPPQTWKKHFKLSRDKGVSRGLAMQRFPAMAGSFSRVQR